MYSSVNTSVNPFLPSSFRHHHNHHPLQYLLSTSTSGNSDDIFSQHRSLPLGPFYSSSVHTHMVTPENNITTTKTLTNPQEDMVDRSANGEGNGSQLLVPLNKVSLKRDRHSKIFTAQGFRDRRVRLSIGIARKFFDLQDLLGYDKASKTLEWLLTKSETAINELASSSSSPADVCPNGGCNKCLSSTTLEFEEVLKIDEANSGNGDARMTSTTKSFVTMDKKIKKSPCKSPMQFLSKESRQKARARARARTKEKLCTKKEFDEPKCHGGTIFANCKKLQGCLPHSHKNYLTPSLKMVCHEIPEPMLSLPIVNEHLTSTEDFTQESTAIREKMLPSLIFNYPSNLIISKDISSNNTHLPSLGQNWETNGAVTRSRFSASMNLSEENQIYGKPWGSFNNRQSL